jgi:hypothetical protein
LTTGSKRDKVSSDGGHGEYYELPEGATTLSDLIEYRNMNYQIGNIFKACYRLGAKEGIDEMYDLKKIKYCIERELARVSKLQCSGSGSASVDGSSGADTTS